MWRLTGSSARDNPVDDGPVSTVAPSTCVVDGCGHAAAARGRCLERQLPRLGRPWRRPVQQVLARDRYVSWICGRPRADTADHVLLRSRGGTDHLSNLRAAHVDCEVNRGGRWYRFLLSFAPSECRFRTRLIPQASYPYVGGSSRIVVLKIVR